nr:DNA replication licensing factor MCM4-like [Chrysemys picta bellii]XP_042712975.1 DNA replication licensing factor MCM4-like [Chrysemys picta bellii]XP_042712976.1 DNA replication licensing factor MCM4-like [Chrysemys picta bellii]XP_042712977.1 DNA replication licensing factor MCM4-like [Chrysemys picta bellii]XP_042712978.1 DNA replication licensing factor MCM4-like [Chrysemys picta bellii]
MRTSPAVDMQSPNAQDVLFSSPPQFRESEITATAHKRKEELAQALKKLIQSKGKTPALKYQQLFDDLCAQSDAAVTKEMFEEALHALADDDFLTVTGKTVRLL